MKYSAMPTNLPPLALLSFAVSTSLSIAPAHAALPAPSTTMTQTSAEQAEEIYDTGQAETLYEKAMELMDQNQPFRACRLFEESQRLDPLMGTQYRLAECYERTGRLMAAWKLFKAVAEAAKQEGGGEREEIARGRVEVLEPRIGRIVLKAATGLSRIRSMSLKLDGEALDRSRWTGEDRMPEVVEPGKHVLEATAPARVPWRQTVWVLPGKTTAVAVPILDTVPHKQAQVTSIAPNPTVIISGIGLSIATVVAGIGCFTVSKTLQEASESGTKWLAEQPSEGHPNALSQYSTVADWNQRRKLYDTVSASLFAIGGSIGLVTLMYALWPHEQSAGAPKIKADAMVMPDAGGILVKGRF